MTSDLNDSRESKSKDGSEEREISYVSVEAALARSNALTLAQVIQDALMRVGLGVIVVLSIGNPTYWTGLVLIVLICWTWSASKRTMQRMQRQIDREFALDALEREKAVHESSWLYLIQLLSTDRSGVRDDLRAMLARNEPLLLCTGLTAVLLIAHFSILSPSAP